MNDDRQERDVPDPARLVHVIHLSDLHFSRNDGSAPNDHVFDPPRTAAGDPAAREGWPEAAELLARDLDNEPRNVPTILCITGDLVHTAHPEEYERAKAFVRQIGRMPLFGAERRLSAVFMVPGNHDVAFELADRRGRIANYLRFDNDLLQDDCDLSDPYSTVRVHDRLNDLGTIVLALNSAAYVQKGRPDEDRGQLDVEQLARVKRQLDDIPASRLRAAIRIALVHHHPVLIPPLVERGYDAVHNSGRLLRLLSEFGFHLVLHGHKHYPHNFTYDARSPFHSPAAASATSTGRMVIVAGGSLGSRSVPDKGLKCNCYNRIKLRWDPQRDYFRVRIDTRRLRTCDDRNNELLPTEWSWDTLDTDDRVYSQSAPQNADVPPVAPATRTPFGEAVRENEERTRTHEYARTRGNLPVVEVRPSLEAGADRYFEARVWLVPHGTRKLPARVVWSAGPKFARALELTREADQHFCASFYYTKGMLIQGRLEFDDGASVLVHIYARVPETYPVVPVATGRAGAAG